MRHSKIKTYFLPVLILLGLSSCLKKDPMNIDPSKGAKNIIEFANTGNDISGSSSTYPEFHIDLGSLANGASATFKINVSYSGVDVAPQDITVNLSLDQATLTTYNTQNGTNYVIPTSDIFSLPTSVVIKKGTHIGQATATINNTNNFDFNASYALPIQIASTSMGSVSANFGKAIYSFGLRNIYDGSYDLHINTVGWGAYGIADGTPMDWGTIGMVTSGANSLVFDAGSQVAFTAGGSQTGFGATNPQFTFDPATNLLIEVKNLVADDGRGRAFKLNPAITDSRYDPTSKTIYAAYIMSQNGRPPQYIYDTLTYIGSR